MPKFHELFTRVLSVLSDGESHHRRTLYGVVLEGVELTESERSETMKGGGNRARSRVHWSLEYLVQAGAVFRPSRGYVQITQLGSELLATSPGGVTLAMVKETDGYKDWHKRSLEKRAMKTESIESDEFNENSSADEETGTPLERIEASVKQIESSVASQLLQRLREEDPEFLEHTVLKLLHAMGYGSSDDDLQHLGGSGDGGVDGVIRQDKFGLELLYIQAKRYGTAVVGRPDIQSFVGALTGQHASRGVFITTSTFSKDAREYARTIQQYRVILVDGEELVRLMIENRVGVVVASSVDIVEIDENFFGDQ